MLDCNDIFLPLSVTALPSGGFTIQWTMRPSVTFNCSPRFYVEVSESGGNWTRINADDPITDECWYEDDVQRRFGVGSLIYYRVVAVDYCNADCFTEYASAPQDTLGGWDKRSWLVARDIVRKEYLRLRYVGSPGWLLRRRSNGTLCTECTDYDTLESVNSSCPVCFGTRIVKGYYNAIELTVDLSGGTSTKDVQSPRSVADDRSYSIRCVAYPLMETYDIWVDSSTGKRYNVREVGSVSRIKGKPLIYQAKFIEIPIKNIEYTIPLTQEAAEITEDGETVSTDGWREGIGYDDL